ncbi:MAG: ATP-grasp domain-containing protein, partial [Actinomycetota bacterium]
DEARAAAAELGGRVAVKAQVRSGGRGKAGGVVLVDDAEGAAVEAARLLGSTLADEVVASLLIEEAIDIAAERYLAVAVEPSRGAAVLMRSDRGGVEIESMADAIEVTDVAGFDAGTDAKGRIEATLIDIFTETEALLVEINPLAETTNGELIALDAKIELDDAADFRRPEELIAGLELDGGSEGATGTEREQAAAELGLRLIELGGDVAVLANGAGLTMATMDAITNLGGSPANFLEIGGDAYTKATPALELVLSQPGVRSLLVNFCGAFARCDVMTAGVLEAWQALEPGLPISFSISGTGQDEARAMVRDQLGIDPHETMREAVAEAVAAAAGAAETTTGEAGS